jgi:hypothetical protein
MVNGVFISNVSKQVFVLRAIRRDLLLLAFPNGIPFSFGVLGVQKTHDGEWQSIGRMNLDGLLC